MSREILFKAKQANNGEWVEGYYARYGFTGKEKHYIVPVYASDLYAFEVDKKTVCQYTGLTDKNGKKIWENDIIKTSRYGKDDGKGSNFAGFDIFSVRWDDGGFALYSKWRRFNLRDNNGYEVIGNIFDNPELPTTNEGA